MAVLIFMYHRTPPHSPDSDWDVPMPVFRDQIHRLLDEGYSFVRFRDAMDQRYYQKRTYISLTFDDGHRSNLEAFEFLQNIKVVPTAFIVSEWSRHKPDIIPPTSLAGLTDHCDFGSHGATHVSLADLSDERLIQELSTSKAFLEETLQQEVTTMSVPGGQISRRVIEAARRCGFALIGTSLEIINSKPRHVLNRVCVRNTHAVSYPFDMAKATRLFWLWRHARLRAAHSLETFVRR